MANTFDDVMIDTLNDLVTSSVDDAGFAEIVLRNVDHVGFIEDNRKGYEDEKEADPDTTVDSYAQLTLEAGADALEPYVDWDALADSAYFVALDTQRSEDRFSNISVDSIRNAIIDLAQREKLFDLNDIYTDPEGFLETLGE